MIYRFFKDLSLRNKLFIGFSTVILVFIIFSAYFLNSLNSIDDIFFGLEKEYKILSLISGLELNNKKLSDDSKAFILTQDVKWENAYDATSLEYDSVLKQIFILEKNQADLETVNKFDNLIGQLKGTELLILAKVREGNVTKAKEYFDNIYEQRQNEASRLVIGLVETKLKEVSDKFDQSHKLADSVRPFLFWLLIISIIIMFFVSVFLASVISRPIQNLFETVQKIMHGDLKARANVSSADEIGKLSANFNDMTEKLESSYNDLENRVKARTAELEEKVTEIENTREAMIRAVETLEDIKKREGPKQ